MSDNDVQNFALRIKKMRIAKGYSKSKLATLIGCDISYIGKIERLEKFPNIKMIFKLAEALEVSAKDLFDFE